MMPKIILVVVIAIFVIMFLVIKSQHKDGEYTIKDFLLEIINHSGDGSNYKRGK